jgi:hypothetical protein
MNSRSICKLRPYPEERPLGRVSKDDCSTAVLLAHPSRRAQERAPQDEGVIISATRPIALRSIKSRIAFA